VKNGERFILSDRNRPFAEIRPLPAARRPFGLARGTVRLPRKFNAPDRAIERLFEGH
jgi:antitoxin (DNA-binding transcriptional repressor) of toxin-antitoxin stability system